MPKYPKHCLDSDFTQLTVCNSVEEVKEFCGQKGVVFQKRHFNGTKLRFQCAINNRRKDEYVIRCNMILVAIQQDTGEFHVYSRGEHNHPVTCRTPRGTPAEKSDRLNGVFRHKYSLPESCRQIGTVDSFDEVEKFRKAQKVYCAQKTFNGEKMRYQCSAWKMDCKYSVYCIINEEGKYQLYERGEHNHSLESGAAIKPKARKSKKTDNSPELSEPPSKRHSSRIAEKSLAVYADDAMDSSNSEGNSTDQYDTGSGSDTEFEVEENQAVINSTTGNSQIEKRDEFLRKLTSTEIQTENTDSYASIIDTQKEEEWKYLATFDSLDELKMMCAGRKVDAYETFQTKTVIHYKCKENSDCPYRMLSAHLRWKRYDLYERYEHNHSIPDSMVVVADLLEHFINNRHIIVQDTESSLATRKIFNLDSYKWRLIMIGQGISKDDLLKIYTACSVEPYGTTLSYAKHNTAKAVLHYCVSMLHSITKASGLTSKCSYEIISIVLNNGECQLYETGSHDHLQKIPQNLHGRIYAPKMVDEWQYLFELKTTDALSKLCTNRKVRRWHKKKNTTRDSNLQRLSYRCTSYKGIRCPYKIMTVEFMPQRFKIYQIGEHIHPMPSQLPYALLFPERLFTKPNGAITDSALQTIQDNLNPDKAQKPSEAHENCSSGSMLESADVNTTKELREIERQAIDSAETIKTQSRPIHNSSNYPPSFDNADVKGFIRDAAALDVKLESQVHEDCRPLTPINIPESSRDGVNNQHGNNLGENFENGAQIIDTNSWDNDVKLFLSDCAQVDIKLEKEAAD